MSASLRHHSAIELLGLLGRREVSALEVLEASIERAEQVATQLNPISVRLYDQARAAAALADRRLARGEGGPLCGLPLTVKDSHFYAGVPCTNGSRTLLDFIPDESCEAIRNLEQAGAIVFAKTTCPEFGMLGITESELYGRTSNPWDRTRTSGGSSGGAAVAVASGISTLSLGGDGGGSIRIPAAFCGVVGFKPTHGVVPREPCFQSWKSLVAYGPMGREVRDVRLMFEVLSEKPASPPAVRNRRLELEGKRILVSEDLGFAPVDEDVLICFRILLRALEAAGAELIYDEPGLGSSVHTWGVTARYDSWKHLSPTMDEAGLGDVTRQVLEFGAQFSDEDARAAERARKRIARAYRDLFNRAGAEVLVTPTLGCEAFAHGLGFPPQLGGQPVELPWLDWASFLYDANLVGMPSCALPIGVGDEGLPVSAQVLALPGGDQAVLDTAEAIEGLLAWQHPHLTS